MIRRFAIVALLVGGASCAPALEDSHYAHDKAATIRVGMTRDEVGALMGRPTHMYLRTITGGGVLEVWTYSEGYDDGRTQDAQLFRIGFDNTGRVVATETMPRPRRTY